LIDSYLLGKIQFITPKSMLYFPTTWLISDHSSIRAVQVMATRPRSDIYINLPALEKLDAMLIVRF
jgi:hypothetical protein